MGRLVNHLDELEAESIYVFRAAYAKLKNVAILWSIGKDSNVVLWPAKKAVFGDVPFPVLFIDTEKEFPQVCAFRDQRIKDRGLNYVQEQCPPVEEMDPTLPPAARLAARKTYGLKSALEKHGDNGLVGELERTRIPERSGRALAAAAELFAKGYRVYVLDGDNIRVGRNANLGFSPDDRAETIRRVGEVANLFADAGFIVISSFIPPYRGDRQRAREAAGERFHEISVKAPLELCDERDPEGLDKRARAGEVRDFTGVSAPYEAPDDPQLVVDTAALTVEDALAGLRRHVEANCLDRSAA